MTAVTLLAMRAAGEAEDEDGGARPPQRCERRQQRRWQRLLNELGGFGTVVCWRRDIENKGRKQVQSECRRWRVYAGKGSSSLWYSSHFGTVLNKLKRCKLLQAAALRTLLLRTDNSVSMGLRMFALAWSQHQGSVWMEVRQSGAGALPDKQCVPVLASRSYGTSAQVGNHACGHVLLLAGSSASGQHARTWGGGG